MVGGWRAVEARKNCRLERSGRPKRGGMLVNRRGQKKSEVEKGWEANNGWEAKKGWEAEEK